MKVDFIMIIGLGVDLFENVRMEGELGRGEWLLEDRIITREEIRRCSASRKLALRYAACFAAKEATLKALGVEIVNLTVFRDVEVAGGCGPECNVVLHGGLEMESERLGIRQIRLSIASNRKHTCAMVILEG